MVVNVAKEVNNDSAKREFISSTGVKIKIMAVAPGLIQKVLGQIKDPVIPMWMNPDKEREEPNPHDPNYQQALQEVTEKRAEASMNTMIMFGVQLVDPLPENKLWLKQLKYVGVTDIDEDDPFELEFAYKKYIATGSADFQKISRLAGVTQEAIEQQLKNFRD